jgi:subfamily B ATP-binding cassette protein MsbA
MKLTRFNKYLYKYWKLQAAVILLGLITMLLSLVNPFLTKLIIDKAYGNKDLKLFLILAIISGSVFIFNGILNAVSSYLARRIRSSVHFDLTKDLFKHLQSLPLSFFNDKSTGEHIFKVSSDVDTVSNFVCNTLPQIIILFPRLLFIFFIVFYLNWRLALFALLLIPVSYIHLYFFVKWLKEITRKMIEKSQDFFSSLYELFSNINLIKAFGKEDYETKRFEENLLKRIDFDLKNAKLENISSFFSSVSDKVISGVIALYGGYQIIKGTFTLGSYTALMIYLIQFIGLIKSIGGFYEAIMLSSISRQRITEILDTKPQIQDRQEAIDYRILEGRIEFRDISFSYKKDEFILQRINFSIEPASKIALVGPSGCGKTTLLSLILRLYEPLEGRILIDSLDIKDIKIKSLKEQIGIALQSSLFWNDTIKNNILYAKETASMDEVIEAANTSEVRRFISRLPRGYDTEIGEDACNISEGQKQRIAIARAVIRRPKILILDEAMSSLDSETEDKIIDNIKREFRDSTVIIVSHRLSTVQKMDLVYFLENPSNMIIGTYEEILKINKKYRELFASQIEIQPDISQRIEEFVDKDLRIS